MLFSLPFVLIFATCFPLCTSLAVVHSETLPGGTVAARISRRSALGEEPWSNAAGTVDKRGTSCGDVVGCVSLQCSPSCKSGNNPHPGGCNDIADTISNNGLNISIPSLEHWTYVWEGCTLDIFNNSHDCTSFCADGVANAIRALSSSCASAQNEGGTCTMVDQDPSGFKYFDVSIH